MLASRGVKFHYVVCPSLVVSWTYLLIAPYSPMGLLSSCRCCWTFSGLPTCPGVGPDVHVPEQIIDWLLGSVKLKSYGGRNLFQGLVVLLGQFNTIDDAVF
jgi:hypothetical protein